MRSIPVAMMWEMLSHQRLSLIAAALGANLLPVMLLSALRMEGPLLPDDSSMILTHVIVMQINMFCFGAAAIAAQGKPARLYTLPARTSTLVAWSLLPAMGLMALESLASTAMVNAVFNLNWPLWGPAMFLAAALAAVQAILWLTEKSAWLPLKLALLALVLGEWFKSRYGAPFSHPDRYWVAVTPSEVAMLLAVVVFAFVIGNVAMARNRRGEPLGSLGIIAWLERVLDPGPAVGVPFRNSALAQFWCEWRRKGWVMPASVLFATFVGCAFWLLFSRVANDLYFGFIAGGWMLSAAAVVGGIALGHCGPDDGTYRIGPFMATRPMTTSDMARIILKVAGWSVVCSWILWAVALLAVYLILWATRSAPPALPPELGWWYYPATLVCAWTVLTVGASIGLAGRPALFAKLLIFAFATFIFVNLGSTYVLSYDAQLQLQRLASLAFGVLPPLATIVVFVMSRKRQLIGWPTVYVGVSVWAALVAMIMFAWTQRPMAPLPIFVLIVGDSTLAVAPLAAAPLALAWNRNR